MIKYARENRGEIIIGINNNSVLEGQNSTPTTLKNVGIQICACINVPLNVTYIYISQRTMAHTIQNNKNNNKTN